MRQTLVLFCLLTTGCLLWSGKRIPNWIETGAKPTLASQPRIEMVLHHTHTMDGKDGGGMVTDASYKAFKESLERVQKETPFLANSGIGIAKPDFVLDMNTEIAEHGKTGAIVSGATLMLVPAFPSSDVVVRASLKDADGVMPFISPGEELYDDTFRDLFLLIESDLATHASS